MALLALWHVVEPPVGGRVMYVFQEPVRGDVEISMTDSADHHPWEPDYTESRVGELLYGIDIMPDEYWNYPVKIKIRRASGHG